MQRLASHVLLAAVLWPLAASAGDPSLPEGWRLPTEAELPDSCPAPDSRRTALVADLNGDHLIEGAYLAVREGGNVSGLLAFVHTTNETGKWFILDTLEMGESIHMCLSLLPVGTYQVLGPDGYDEPKVKLTIKHPGILYYRPESAESLFTWEAGRFERYWLSD